MTDDDTNPYPQTEPVQQWVKANLPAAEPDPAPEPDQVEDEDEALFRLLRRQG